MHVKMSMRMFLIVTYLIVCCVFTSLIASCGSWDSEMVELEGHVRLEDGTPVPGVKVVFFWPTNGSESDGQSKTRTTDSNGRYHWEYDESFAHDRVTITPRSDMYSFVPPEYDLASAYDGYGDLDFIAIGN